MSMGSQLFQTYQDLPAFAIAYQPIVNVPARRVVAYEALVRGPHGISYPQLVAGMDSDTLRRFHCQAAAEAIRCAVELGLAQRKASLTLNLLPDLEPGALAAPYIREVAEHYGLPAEKIIIELTEDHKLSLADLHVILRRNGHEGFASAMDDFGAGYSGLTAFVECRPEVLKLDRGLIRNIDGNEARQKIVGAFVRVCNSLQMTLVAEGVETLDECRRLRKLGVKYMQGFLFSKPVINALPRFAECDISEGLQSLKGRRVPEDSRLMIPRRSFGDETGSLVA
jgi:EAL domain-containing protein (putative c-di-GMP-specific phosphodiesterase class I)